MKRLFLAALAVFAFTSVNAQEIHFGAKAGVNFASITGDFSNDYDGRTSFHIGAVAEIQISDKFSVQPELIYSAQGAKEKYYDSEFDYKEEATYKYDYLNLPVIAKYYVVDGLSIEAGPQIGLLVSAKLDFEAVYDGELEIETVDYKKIS